MFIQAFIVRPASGDVTSADPHALKPKTWVYITPFPSIRQQRRFYRFLCVFLLYFAAETVLQWLT